MVYGYEIKYNTVLLELNILNKIALLSGSACSSLVNTMFQMTLKHDNSEYSNKKG